MENLTQSEVVLNLLKEIQDSYTTFMEHSTKFVDKGIHTAGTKARVESSNLGKLLKEFSQFLRDKN